MRCLLIFLFLVPLLAQPPAREVDRIFTGFHNATPGCAVGVAQAGKTVLARGYGMADLERGVPITPDTVFESGSVAKQFTATVLLLLAQQGRLSLDKPLSQYLPELAHLPPQLTLRQVLQHTGGLREWRTIAALAGFPEGTRVYANEDLLRFAARQRGLNFDPGTHYSYSNTGFNITPLLVDRLLKEQSFQQFSQTHIFGPLNMTSTRWRDDFRRIIPRRALAYTGEGESFRQATPIENIIGAGGLLTTVQDLLLWNENFVHGRVGGQALLKELQTPAKLASGRVIGYALGIQAGQYQGLSEIAHSGATGGYRTWLGRYPERQLSVAVLCNSAKALPTTLGRQTAALWLKTPAPNAPAAAPELAALAGLYRKLRDNTVLRLSWKEGQLLTSTGQAVNAKPEGGSRISITDANDTVLYEKVAAYTPAAAELAQYAGSYASEETGSTLVISATESGLQLRIGSTGPLMLQPTFRDAFAGPAQEAYFFRRDGQGRISGLSVGDARTWDIRFQRR